MTNNFIVAKIFLVVDHITDNRKMCPYHNYDVANYIMGTDAA